ncbi:MAG: hypothetical protein RLZZ622_820, partial [Planctomycetota bacterium]
SHLLQTGDHSSGMRVDNSCIGDHHRPSATTSCQERAELAQSTTADMDGIGAVGRRRTSTVESQ